jgi:hypothetical protein
MPILWIEEEKEKELDWDALYEGSLTREEIKGAIAKPSWQRFRLELVGKTLSTKYLALWWWKRYGPGEKEVRAIQVTNYINALKRGGLIK